jgi:hypothetical protein
MKTTDTKFRWVHNPQGKGYFYDVGILADGTLHNPRRFPDDLVRAAVMAALERKHQRRVAGAKKAAVTRSLRYEKKIYEIVQNLRLGHKYGPSPICVICEKSLSDEESIERGIGPDCWQKWVMRPLTKKSEAVAVE